MKLWSFLINPFLVATKDSYRTAKKLGDFTVSALTTQTSSPFIEMLNMLLPASESYNAAYMAWTSQRGMQKGNTSNLNAQLKILQSQKIEDWDIAIQQVYKQNTPQYISLLPNRRSPFQAGTQEGRINAVGALSLAIGADVQLQTVKTDIDTFFNSIKIIYTGQKGSKSTTGNNSSALEGARINLCIALYGVLGQLMNYYLETPEAIANFIDVETLRNREQDAYQKTIKGGATALVLTHTFKNGEQLRLVNRGNTDIAFALVADKNDPLPATFTTVPANNEITVAANSLGDTATNRFLIVKNLAPTEAGACTVELL